MPKSWKVFSRVICHMYKHFKFVGTEKITFYCSKFKFFAFFYKMVANFENMHLTDPQKFGSCGFKDMLRSVVASLTTEKITFYCSKFEFLVFFLKNSGKF